MREIEFRGKDITGIMNHDWFYGSLDTSFNVDLPRIICKDKWGNTMLITVDKETVGQYTGLKDKNGTKIFDGDLLYYRNSNHDEEDGAMEVVFEDGAFMIAGDILVPLHETYSWELEVVGNIYDNPELVVEVEG